MGNNFEIKVKQLFERNGFTVLQTGWPDFLIKRNGRYEGIAAVEAKQGSDKVRPNQKEMHNMLKEAGIPVYVVRPETLKAAEKQRFKKIVSITDYASMIKKIEQLESTLKFAESSYYRWLEDEVNTRMKTVKMARLEIEELKEGISVESVILKKEIESE